MSSGSRSNSTSSMRQDTLRFQSSKRTASASGAKKTAGHATRRKVDSSPEESGRITEIGSGVPRDKEGQEELDKISLKDKFQHDHKKEPIPEELPELNIKDPRWRKLFTDAKAKRGGLPLGAF